MDFTWSDDQRMLDDTVRRLLDKRYGFEQRGRIVARPEGFDEAVWGAFAELGLLGLNVPEAGGGLDASPIETMIVMEAFGRALVVEPYVSTAVVAARLLRAAGGESRERCLDALAAGTWRCGVAALEAGSGFDFGAVDTTARQTADGWLLRGAKTAVLHGNSAHAFIVSARTPAGLSLFLLDAGTSGLAARHFPTLDGQRISELSLPDVSVPHDALVGPEGAGFDLLDSAIDFGIVALCAEAVGAATRLLDMTLEYVRTRKQFGQAIGRFQAVAHRTAEMLSAIEQARSITLHACAALMEGDAVERRLAVSAAKTLIGESGRFVGEQAVQLHGGIGMTDALPVGHYFRRLTAIDMTWGNADHHVARYSRAMRGPETYWPFDERAACPAS